MHEFEKNTVDSGEHSPHLLEDDDEVVLEADKEVVQDEDNDLVGTEQITSRLCELLKV